jgi:hypothetical protein
VSGQDDVYPAPTAEIHDHIARLKVRKTRRIATTSRELESNLRHYGKLRLTVESLIHCIARTGLSLVGSTGLFAAAYLGKLAIATLYHLLDLIGNHVGLL